ncbi:MAG: hypothetical protein COA88_06460 [Kordia sp.]|nr:MAG: hypothetical protein COA88_06460 [Kordia sp.]
MHTRIFSFILILASYATSYAQEPIYKHFGVDEGLPSSEVYDIYQDKEGYIWFATDKGLSRYNGYEFENFDISNGLPGNVVLRFYPQTNGQVWCYTLHHKALFYFNENFDGFRAYKHNSILNKALGKGSIVKSIFIDKFNTVHFGGVYINGELLINKKGKVSKKYFFEGHSSKKSIVLKNDSKGDVGFYFRTIDKNIINNSYSNKSTEISHIHALWLVRNKKAVFMDGNSIAIISRNKSIKTIKSQFMTLGVKAIDSTRFFAGYHYGGSKIINSKGKIIQEYLKGKSVTNFLIDHEGGYWFTTLNSGVYYIKNPSIAVFKQPENSTSFHINSLVKKNNELLIGYKNGDFAKIGTNRVFKLKKEASITTPSIVEYDSISDKTYVFFNHTIEKNNEFVANTYSIKLSEPSLNGTIFTSGPSGYSAINKNKYTPFPYRIQDVSVWKKDTLIATPFGVFKKLNDSIITLSKESELLGYRSDDIDVSTSGDCFFIATQSAGVVIYGKNIYNISKKNGLTSNIINEIHVENDTTIWACTNKGLNRIVFNNTSFSVTSIDKNAGLLSNEVEDVEIINDTLWVGTKNGLCYMPKKVLDNKQLDNIYFELKEVKVNDVIYSDNEIPKLNYNENKISFFVQGISYAKNNNLQYQYRLKEIDNKWSSTKNRSINFPNLEYGTYTFQVIPCIGSKCYTEKQLEYKFIITPPFWKTGWFYIGCFLALGGVVYAFFKIRVLTYNKDVIRELVRLLIKRLKRDEKYIEIRMNGERIKISTNEILYIKSSGNYLDIICSDKIYTIRCKIGDFIATTPDALEYLRVHRSYIIRIDQVTGKSKNSVTIKEYIIPVGETYLKQLDKIQF